MKHFIYFPILLVLFSFCSNKAKLINQNTEKECVIINLSSDRKLEITHFKDLIDSCYFIKLETNRDCLIKDIGKIIFYNGKYYINDALYNNLFVFDKNGVFIDKIGQRGNGPGEYIDISDFLVDTVRNKILLLSVEKKCIHEYDLDGRYHTTIRLPFQATKFAKINKNLIGYFIGYYDENNINLYITDLEGDIVRFGFKYPESTFSMNLTNLTGNIASNYEGALFAESASSYLFQIKSDSSYAKYHIICESEFWPESKRYNLKEFMMEAQYGKVNFLSSTFAENDNMLLFTYNLKLSEQVKDLRKRKAFFFKRTNELVTQEQLCDDNFFSIMSEIKGSINSKFYISVISPIEYHLNYQDFSMENKKLLDIPPETINKKDNPILYVYKFKESL